MDAADRISSFLLNPPPTAIAPAGGGLSERARDCPECEKPGTQSGTSSEQEEVVERRSGMMARSKPTLHPQYQNLIRSNNDHQ